MTSYYGGLGPMTNGVHWMELVIVAFFVGLRLYTRKAILNSVGLDDYITVLALILQLVYTCFIATSSHYGLGRKVAEVGNPVAYATAAEYELFSQTAGIMCIGVGKLAVGAFLLRIVRNKIQIAVIWVCLVITVLITLFASICVIVQCIPVQKSWNPMVEGYCWIDFSNIGYAVGSWFVAADFSFAILPWFVVWGLNMKRKEKITVACGLSLGIFAGVCGIIRTVALSGLNAQEYIYDTVPMLLWSATETSVTILCSSIPVLRPLYSRIKYGKDGKSSSSENTSYKLPMYASRKYGRLSRSGRDASALDTTNDTSHELVGKFSTRNTSNEDILRGAAAIERTDEITINYESMGKRG